jgi:hypothetical protein
MRRRDSLDDLAAFAAVVREAASPRRLPSSASLDERRSLPHRSRSCRLDRPQDGLQQVVVVARASFYRERFDLGARNSSLAQSPLHAFHNGESIFILTDQGDALSGGARRNNDFAPH